MQAQHGVGVACCYIGYHAVSAKQFFAALALSHVGYSENSSADSAFILQRLSTSEIKNRLIKNNSFLGILILGFC